ncbi:hypothetical protein AB4156_17680 [Cupriavidus sp. 2MCAB6]
MFAQLWVCKPEEDAQAQAYSVKGLRTAVAGRIKTSIGKVEGDNGM